MTDQQLHKCLNVVGYACFAIYYEDFIDPTMTRLDIAEMLVDERDYTMQACYERIRHARRIIYAGRAADALEAIAYSDRVDPEAIEIARDLVVKVRRRLIHQPQVSSSGDRWDTPPPRAKL